MTWITLRKSIGFAECTVTLLRIPSRVRFANSLSSASRDAPCTVQPRASKCLASRLPSCPEMPNMSAVPDIIRPLWQKALRETRNAPCNAHIALRFRQFHGAFLERGCYATSERIPIELNHLCIRSRGRTRCGVSVFSPAYPVRPRRRAAPADLAIPSPRDNRRKYTAAGLHPKRRLAQAALNFEADRGDVCARFGQPHAFMETTNVLKAVSSLIQQPRRQRAVQPDHSPLQSGPAIRRLIGL